MLDIEKPHMTSAAEIAKWLDDNMAMPDSWTKANAASKGAEVAKNYGRYALMWALCVAKRAAIAARNSEEPNQRASSVVFMVDRKSYGSMNDRKGMSRQEMELIVHHVLGNKDHPIVASRDDTRQYRLSFDSQVTSSAESIAATAALGPSSEAQSEDTEFGALGSSGPYDSSGASGSFGLPVRRAVRLRRLRMTPRKGREDPDDDPDADPDAKAAKSAKAAAVASWVSSEGAKDHGAKRPVPYASKAYTDSTSSLLSASTASTSSLRSASTSSLRSASTASTASTDSTEPVTEPVVEIVGIDFVAIHRASQDLFGKAVEETVSNPNGMLILVQDMYTDDAFERLAVEGHDYAKYSGLIIIGIPPLSATKARQLVARIDRVITEKRAAKSRRFVMFIRTHTMPNVEDIGSTDGDKQVAEIERALVNAALDCDKNVTQQERSAAASQLPCSRPATKKGVSLFV